MAKSPQQIIAEARDALHDDEIEYSAILARWERGQEVATVDLVSALAWRVQNQRRELAKVNADRAELKANYKFSVAAHDEATQQVKALAAELAIAKNVQRIDGLALTALIARVAALEAALIYSAFAQHATPLHMLPKGITLIDDDEVIVFVNGKSIHAKAPPLETPGDAWLCVCGLTVKKRYQCLCGGREDNSRADRFTVTGYQTKGNENGR